MDQEDRVGGRARTWPQSAAARRSELLWLRRLRALREGARERLARWLLLEVSAGRLLPWLPVAFGLGIVLYFAAEREPDARAAAALALGCTVAAVLARRRPVAFPLLIGTAALTLGFAVATLQTARVAHPILRHAAWSVAVTGHVEIREERERTDRIVIRVHALDGRRLDAPPERVRLSVRKGTAPPVGSFVALKARLNPPLKPLRPGGYNFARDLYFQRIGASGFALGAIRQLDPPAPADARLRYSGAIGALRDAIDARIRAAVPGDAGAIASALITGKRDAISSAVNEAMYVSSLGHVLSISGYHMALVAGVVFATVRALLALVPLLALRHPIKKWAAVAALLAAAFYLMLSGAEVATQRAFIMTAIVLTGVLIDRAALTIRTLAAAALGVMLLAPQAVVHPSFQMSFAATLALVAAYERGVPWLAAGAETSRGARFALWGGRQVVMLMLASVVAGLATTLYAAYHFHRLAPYGVLANLLGMPIVSIWVMPAGLLALLAVPFGLDGLLWQAMGQGIEWMVAVARFVAGLPGAVGRVTAFGIAPVLLGTLALLLACLLRSPLRWSAVVAAVLALSVALRTPLPDVLVGAGGEAVAVRGANGALSVMRRGSDTFAVRDWLAADADARPANDPALAEGVACDEVGCIVRLADGRAVALVLAAEAFEEDCERAALIVTQRTAPPGCAATVIDRTVWPRTGALALYSSPDGWRMVAATPRGTDRPWAPAPRAIGDASAPTAPGRPERRDATPRSEDLAPGD
ncbi:MAG: competence protein ComEC [Bradyrhizobiaceae bacterium]|nr:MAG: competence protein ComEC [Bradyrhizobiaceae bacterium]